MKARSSTTLPEVRTASHFTFARSVVCWGGMGGDHDPDGGREVHVVDVDARRARKVGLQGGLPAERGGAVAAPISPTEWIMLCGSDHVDEEELLAPFRLTLRLPE